MHGREIGLQSDELQAADGEKKKRVLMYTQFFKHQSPPSSPLRRTIVLSMFAANFLVKHRALSHFGKPPARTTERRLSHDASRCRTRIRAQDAALYGSQDGRRYNNGRTVNTCSGAARGC